MLANMDRFVRFWSEIILIDFTQCGKQKPIAH